MTGLGRVFSNLFKTNLISARCKSSYEGEGKTSVHILNNDVDSGLMINGFSEVGFRLNNDMTVLGSMIVFPKSVLSWRVNDVDEVNEDSLALFSVLDPRVDILVLGIGDTRKNHSYYTRLVPIMRKFRLSMEILPTEQACSTFNFLTSEGRFVVGAMIPPRNIITTDDDVMNSNLRYHNLYETTDPLKLF